MFSANTLWTAHILWYISSLYHQVETYLINKAQLKPRIFGECPILFWCGLVVHFMVCLQTIYSVRAGKIKGGNVFFLVVETYPLVEKSWKRWYSALALQCIPAPQLAFFFLPYNMWDLVLKSQEEGWRGGGSLSLTCTLCKVTLVSLTVLSFHASKLNGSFLWLSWVGVTAHMAFGL